MITTTNMSLTSWNLTSDYFNHTALASNWDKVDLHDHTTGKGAQIPVGGLANGAVNSAALASSAVTSAKIGAAAVGTAALGVNSVTNDKIGTFPAARVYNSANLATTDATPLDLTFNTERFDGPSGLTLHSTSSNTGRMTLPVAGVYLLTLNVEWAANATGYRKVSFLLNGSLTIASASTLNLGASVPVPQTLVTIYKFAASDYVHPTVLQNSGSTINVLATSAYSPEFSATWLHSG